MWSATPNVQQHRDMERKGAFDLGSCPAHVIGGRATSCRPVPLIWRNSTRPTVVPATLSVT